MRITQSLNRSRQVPTRRQYEFHYNIPFQELYHLQLEDRSKLKTTATKHKPCVSQLIVLLQCFKDTDFNQRRCTESINAYYSCMQTFMDQRTLGAKDRKLHDVKNVRDLTQDEANRLLKSKPIN